MKKAGAPDARRERRRPSGAGLGRAHVTGVQAVGRAHLHSDITPPWGGATGLRAVSFLESSYSVESNRAG